MSTKFPALPKALDPSSPVPEHASVESALSEGVAWLREFAARHGRPLRVLHVGNIANNAYLNAKFLRSVGVEAHVLSHDYYHVMATPEWEEVELLHGHRKDFMPRFSRRDLRGYRRPAWFVDGPLPTVASKIGALCGEPPTALKRLIILVAGPLNWLTRQAIGPSADHAVTYMVFAPRVFLRKLAFYVLPAVVRRSRIVRLMRKSIDVQFQQQAEQPISPKITEIVEQFNVAFPNRPDRLTAEDCALYRTVSGYFVDMFRHYDIVQSYATEPIHALLAGKRPYVAYEHGTLRDFTQGDSALHRLTSLAYRQADHTFITNGDCLAYAHRLGIEKCGPIAHPIDVDQHRANFAEAVTALRREIDGDLILYCPIRHDWAVKGTDVHLRALPLIKKRFTGRVKLVLVRWGNQIAESEELLEQLDCSENVVWRPSMCRIAMIKHMQAAEVVLDQMTLPHFGATAPQAIATGTPVVSSYQPDSTRWIIPEPAPILSALSPEDVCDAVLQALDPVWRTDYQQRARAWTDRYHHNNNIIAEHLRVYQKVLGHD